jgi:predicted hydrocarbon binding protein
MNLSPAYQRWQEETLQKGRQEGRQEGRLEERQQMVENVLKARFGSLDEELSGAIAPMLQLPPEELTRLLLNLSREELLVWFGDVSRREDTLREGRRETVENFLRVRFGSLNEELSEAIAPLLQLPPEELSRLLLNLSREELLERFGGQSR